MRAGWSRVTSLSNLLLIPPFPFSCAQDSKLCRDLERLGNRNRQASLFIFSLLLSRLSLSLSLFSFHWISSSLLAASPPESKPSRRWGWWWSSKWWWGDRPSVVMVVAGWCCDGDQISSLSCLLVPDLFRSPLPCLLFPDPDPDLG
ncbi:hypothetical protein F2Q69_00019388 [Brassica cretica]|uniref:Uncharacterized protein n=1 Tax=Brassica cretica TaxID=69181 RepID=A0A8S9Q0M7_BRACR|nr:hypothetical protein F2Q69_00019388 [Brassica cretica]